VRNKDIVFDENVKLSEDALFENSSISFDEVRRWSILRITRDPGVMISVLGLIFALLYIAAILIKRRNNFS
jgi:hypothetical protein